MFTKLPAVAALGILLTAAPALAQTPAVTTAPAPVNHGPAIPGLCVLSQQDAIDNSALGKFVGERMVQFEAQARAELDPQKTALDRDIEAFQTSRASLSAEAANQQANALNERGARLQQLGQLRGAELQATENKALQRISQEITPILTQVYQTRGCSLLVNDQAVIAVAPAMDITPDVVRALDAKITQFQLDMERATAQLPGASAPAAR